MAENLKEHALRYAAKGWKIFPVTPDQKTPLARLVPRGFKDATDDPEVISQWWSAAPNANIGLSLEASGLVCVDIDSYKDDCAAHELGLFEKLPKTLEQQSARGGQHFIYCCAANQTYTGSLGLGIDVKHKGYILVSPSSFAGGVYTWLNDLEPAPAPDWLANWKETKVVSVAGSRPRACSFKDHVNSNPVDVDAAIQAASKGESWHNNVLSAVASMVAKGLSDKEILSKALLATMEGYTFQQTALEVQKMIDSARAKGFGEVGRFGTGLASSGGGSTADRVKCNHLTISAILMNHQDWAGAFGYDSFAGKRTVLRPIPYDQDKEYGTYPRLLEDQDFTKVCCWLNGLGMASVHKQTVIDAVYLVCKANSYNPVQDYLDDCQAAHPRDDALLAEWMQIYLGVEPGDGQQEAYVQAVSKLMMVQAVARIRKPGCKADSVIIVEGNQGKGKSTSLSILAPKGTFGDQLPPMGSKDAASYLKGKTIIELGELSFLSKAEIEVVKGFITRTDEIYRPAYGREEVWQPRTCVFVGTTNRSDYLNDDTGNRRFLPIKTGEIDLEGLKEVRDRLWGAATHAYDANERYWLTGEVLAYAGREAEQRQETDVWVETIREKLGRVPEITLNEAISLCHGPDFAQRTTLQDQRRMSRCLILAGWRKQGRYTSGISRNQVRFVNQERSEDHGEEHFDF